jgi:hypothetical protein
MLVIGGRPSDLAKIHTVLARQNAARPSPRGDGVAPIYPTARPADADHIRSGEYHCPKASEPRSFGSLTVDRML